MSIYDLHKYLYALADDLNTANQERLNRLISATRKAQFYSYVQENLNTPHRYDENIGYADPSENRSKRYANHRAPKQLPPRHDLRRYTVENHSESSKGKSPSVGNNFYRKASLEALPKKLASEIKSSVSDSAVIKMCLLEKTANGDFIISKNCIGPNGVEQVLSKEIKVSSKDRDYQLLDYVWNKSPISSIKVSYTLDPVFNKTKTMGFEVNTHFYNLIKRARLNEENI